MRKILFINHNMDYGGAQRVLINLLKELSHEKDLEITLFLLEYDGAFLLEVPSHVEIRYLSYSVEKIIREKKYIELPVKLGVSFFRRVFGDDILCRFVQRLLIKDKYSVQIAVKEGISKKMLAYSHREIRRIFWVHTDLRNFAGDQKKDDFYYGQSDEIVCVSDKAKEGFIGKHPLLRNRIHVVNNIIDCDDIVNKANTASPYDGDCCNVVNIGRLSKEKAQSRLIKAHKALLDAGYYHELHIVGEGDERQTLESLINQYSLNDTVTLWGAQNNPYPFIKDADFYIHSSVNEGLPTVLFEAICLHVPIVSTDVSGVREVLEDGKYGLIIENSYEGLLAGYEKMLLDEGLRMKFSDATADYADRNHENLQAFLHIIKGDERIKDEKG